LEYKGITLSPRYTDRRPGESAEQGFRHDIKRAAVERAKARGAYTVGCPKKADPLLAQELRDAGADVEMIATTLGVSERTVFRYLK
jgi:hypothetical protein